MLGQLQEDFDRNLPSSNVKILAINEAGEESQNATAAALNDLPLLQDVDSNNNNVSQVWAEWDVVWRDVRIVDSNQELTEVLNLTTNDLNVSTNYDRLRGMILDAALSTRVVANAWQNPTEPLDINDDGVIAPGDVLTLVNQLNDEGPGELPAPSGSVQAYYDPSGDNFLTALDALRVIQQLNRFNVANGEPAGEPDVVEATAPATSAATDALFAYAVIEDDEDEVLAFE